MVLALCYFGGWIVTTVVVALFWIHGKPGRGPASGLVLGVAAGLLWPLALWITLAAWWYRRAVAAQAAAGSTDGLDARIAEASSFVAEAEREDMPTSRDYWTAELARLTEQRTAERAASSTPPVPRRTTPVVLGCTLGAVLTCLAVLWPVLPSTSGRSAPAALAGPSPRDSLSAGTPAAPSAHSPTYTYHVEGNHRVDSVGYVDAAGHRVVNSYFAVDPNTSGAPLPWTLTVPRPSGGDFISLLAQSTDEANDTVLTCRITDATGAVVAAQTKRGPLTFCLVTVDTGSD